MQRTFKTAVAILTAIVLSPLVGYAMNAETDPNYYLIKGETISFTEADSGKPVTPEQMQDLGLSKEMDKNPLAVGAIINTGAAAWGVITSGAPASGVDASHATATPGLSFNWNALTGWKGPKEVIYSYKVTNLMGIDVIKVKYKVAFFYGGTEDSTKTPNKVMKENTYVPVSIGDTATKEPVIGSYIINFTVRPVEIDIKWGWKFDLTVKMSDPMNIGTKLRPIAYLQSELYWTISNAFSTQGGNCAYSVDGLGNFKDLTQEITGINDGLPVPQEMKTAPEVNWN